MKKYFLGLVATIGLTLAGCASDASEETTTTESAATTPDPSGAPYPVVLLHGMAGFGKLEVGPLQVTYFKGVVEELTKHGESVYVTIAPPYDTSEVRAQAIAKQIDEILARTGKKKVNLIGHSQGGLDARVLASPHGLGYGDRIASITTVATPHRGSAVADALLEAVDVLPEGPVDEVLDGALKLLEITAYELKTDAHLRAQGTELTEKYMREVFNPKYVNDPRVAYKSYAGRTNLRTGVLDCNDATYPNDPFDVRIAQPMLVPLAAFLEEGLALKVNDGLVTVESAKWGTFEECVAADHLQEVGQLGPFTGGFDSVGLFTNIVKRIRKAGF
jgi:triacylglycerol lipase